MNIAKKQLTNEALASQLAERLPERHALNWSLITLDVDTGNINVLSYDNFDTCANAAANLLAAGTLILQRCTAN
jgi:hypothetical protein